jgi:hypothetical protein
VWTSGGPQRASVFAGKTETQHSGRSIGACQGSNTASGFEPFMTVFEQRDIFDEQA